MSDFDVEKFKSQLKSEVGKDVEYFKEGCSSTMDICLERLTAGKTSCLILTEFQTKGRGTNNRKWESPATFNLYFTVGLVLSPEASSNHDLYQEKTQKIRLATSLAVCNAIRGAGAENALIKWPNDVFINGKKTCGVLIESNQIPVTSSSSPSFVWGVSIGVGVNVNMPLSSLESAGLEKTATSIKIELGRDSNRESILASFCNDFQLFFEKSEIPELMKKYEQFDGLKGKVINVYPKNIESGNAYLGRVIELKPNFFLAIHKVKEVEGKKDEYVNLDDKVIELSGEEVTLRVV